MESRQRFRAEPDRAAAARVETTKEAITVQVPVPTSIRPTDRSRVVGRLVALAAMLSVAVGAGCTPTHQPTALQLDDAQDGTPQDDTAIGHRTQDGDGTGDRDGDRTGAGAGTRAGTGSRTDPDPGSTGPGDQAMADDDAIAAATDLVRAFVEAEHTAMTTGDTAPLLEFSTRDCLSCTGIARVAEQIHAGGGGLADGYERGIGDLTVITGTSPPILRIALEQTEQVRLDAAGTERERFAAETVVVEYHTGEEDGTWKVHAIERLQG